MRDTKIYTMLNAGKALAIASSTNASPINVEATGHGFVTGDRVTIFGHATNTAANGTWVVTKVDDNNLTLDGSTGNGIGAGTGTISTACAVEMVEDYKNLSVSIASDGGGTADIVVKCVGSVSDTAPNIGAARSASNVYEYIDMVDLQDNASIDGDTGLTFSSADDYRMFEINTNGLKYLSFLIISGTTGTITIKLRTFTK